ncbi:MAG: hypothetical protein V9G14_04220 [Cypionkella sp.]
MTTIGTSVPADGRLLLHATQQLAHQLIPLGSKLLELVVEGVAQPRLSGSAFHHGKSLATAWETRCCNSHSSASADHNQTDAILGTTRRPQTIEVRRILG